MASFVLAIDQGTTSTRAILFGADTSVAAVAQQEFPQHFPADGEVEHDPEDLWSTHARDLPRAPCARPARRPSDIAAIGITNQRETTLVWDRATGQPMHRAIVWQDRRTAGSCARLRGRRPRADVRGQDRTSARSLFLRHQACVAARSRAGRTRARPRAANSPSARSTLICCGGSPAARCTPPTRPTRRARCCSTSIAAAGTTICWRCSACPKRSCRTCCDSSAAFGVTDPELFGGRDPDLRHRRRSAGGADRAGLLHARHGQIDLWHRLLRAAQYRRHAGRLQQPAPDDDRLSARRRAHLCARRLDLRRRRGGAVAARRPASRAQRGGRPARSPQPPIRRRRSFWCRPSSASAHPIGGRTCAARCSA